MDEELAVAEAGRHAHHRGWRQAGGEAGLRVPVGLGEGGTERFPLHAFQPTTGQPPKGQERGKHNGPPQSTCVP